MARIHPIARARAQQASVIACLGYALFLATNATVIWGGVFPFLPFETQTRSVTTTFFVAQASVFAAYYVWSVAKAYYRPASSQGFSILGASLPYLCGWLCLLALPYLEGFLAPLTPCAGVLVGYGAARFFMAWQRLFAAQKAAVANTQIIVGNVVAPIIYFLLHLIPTSVTALLIAFVFMPLFSLCIVLTARSVDLQSPMFTDIPRDHPSVYRLLVKDYWRSALCVGSVAFACGVMRAVAINTPQVVVVVNSASMAALLVTALGLLGLWRFRPLRLNISIFFHALYPVLITAFMGLALFGQSYLDAFAAALYAIYGCTVILTMIQCAQAARDRAVNPVFIYGFVAGIMYALHDLGFLFGSSSQESPLFGLAPLASTALVAVYMLSMMFFVAQGGIKAALSPNHLQAGRIELVFTNARSQRNRPTEKTAVGPITYADKTAKQCALLQAHFKLTNREAEIVESIARGYTVSAIASHLSLSENTVRTHTKRLYTKLDIHKKQQLIELVQTFDPDALNASV